MSTITVNSHADNHFYEYIYLFQIIYYMILYYIIFKFDLNVKHRSDFFALYLYLYQYRILAGTFL